jgi:hypothetical protein
MNLWRGSLSRYLTFAAASLLAACTTQQQISPQATSGLTKVRAQAVQLKEELSRTNDSAEKLSESSGSELGSSIASLSSSLDSLNSTLGTGGQSVRSAQDQVAAYFANWDKQTRGMSEEMQKTSKERQAEAAASFGSLQAAIADVRTDLSPYVADMTEIVTYLRTDQTPAGLDAVSPRLSSTIAREPEVQKDLDELIAQIDAIQDTTQ